MKKNIFIVVLFFYFCAFVQINAQDEKGINFYSFNTAFQNMKIQVVTPEGKIYSAKWEFIHWDPFLKRNEYKEIFFQTNGRNCLVKIFFKNSKNKICRTTFLLNDLDYSDRSFYVLISSYGLTPKLFSNFGPYEENMRFISVWHYPEDDVRENPFVRYETKMTLGFLEQKTVFLSF